MLASILCGDGKPLIYEQAVPAPYFMNATDAMHDSLSTTHEAQGALSLSVHEDQRAGIVDRIPDFICALRACGGWLTRKQLGERLGWDERTVRAVAEAAGPEIVRGQLGFCFFENATIEQINHSANQALSQAGKMTAYGLGLMQRVHKRVG